MGWYLFSDSADYWYSTGQGRWVGEVNVELGGRSWIDAALQADSAGGTALRVVTVLTAGYNWPYAGVGCTLDPFEHDGLDFTGLRSLTLRARGKGTVSVRLESSVMDGAGHDSHQYTGTFMLSDTWATYTILTDSLHISPLLADSSLYPWTLVARAIDRIEFQFDTRSNARDDTLAFDVDDVYFDGVGLETFIR